MNTGDILVDDQQPWDMTRILCESHKIAHLAT